MKRLQMGLHQRTVRTDCELKSGWGMLAISSLRPQLKRPIMLMLMVVLFELSKGTNAIVKAADEVSPVTIVDTDTPTLILKRTAGPQPRTWHIFGNDQQIVIRDQTFLCQPFIINAGLGIDSALEIEANGNVGFGTPDAQTKLHAVSGFGTAIRLEQDTSLGHPAQFYDIQVSEDGLEIYDWPGSTIPFRIEPAAFTDSLVIKANGIVSMFHHVGIGTLAPDANSKLDIRSGLTNGLLAVRPDAGAHFLRVENTGGIFRAGVQGNGDAQLGALTAGKGLNLLAGGSSKVAVNASGQISFGSPPPAITTHALLHSSGANLTLAGVWTNASSRALKQDIEPITSDEARDTVRALQPVGYRYKSELDERYVGFIAEDVPELVATKDRKGLSPMDIVGVLTKVVQDQQTKLDAQQLKLEKLEKQEALIAALTERLEAIERANATAP